LPSRSGGELERFQSGLRFAPPSAAGPASRSAICWAASVHDTPERVLTSMVAGGQSVFYRLMPAIAKAAPCLHISELG
jgi:hypothetical protein